MNYLFFKTVSFLLATQIYCGNCNVSKSWLGKSVTITVPGPQSNGQVITCLLTKKSDTTIKIQYYNKYNDDKEKNMEYGIKYPIEHNTCSFIINHVTDLFFDRWTITTGYKIVRNEWSTLHYEDNDLTIERIGNDMIGNAEENQPLALQNCIDGGNSTERYLHKNTL